MVGERSWITPTSSRRQTLSEVGSLNFSIWQASALKFNAEVPAQNLARIRWEPLKMQMQDW